MINIDCVMNTDSQKFEAIKALLRKGARSNEWQEAGLLEAISHVVYDDNCDLSETGIATLVEEAKNS